MSPDYIIRHFWRIDRYPQYTKECYLRKWRVEYIEELLAQSPYIRGHRAYYFLPLTATANSTHCWLSFRTPLEGEPIVLIRPIPTK